MSRRFASIITSPPYFDVQDYGVPNQIGWGQSLVDYLTDLRHIFEACAELATDKATKWLVVSPIRREGKLLPLPELILQQAQDAGWTGREIVTWEKAKALPWTKHGELRDVTERLILLSKAADFTFDSHALLVPEPATEWWQRYPERYSPEGRMPTNFWRIPIPTQGSWRNGPLHACPFPYELTFRMITLVTKDDDLILDPFAGVGSVPAMANAMGRLGYGVELSPRYVSQYEATLAASADWWDSRRKQIVTALARRSIFRNTIMELRLLKYARLIGTHLRSHDIDLKWVRASKNDKHPDQRFKVVSAEFELACGDGVDFGRVLALAEAKARRRPLSKFGIQPAFKIGSPKQASVRGYWYPSGKFWRGATTAMPSPDGEPHVLASFCPDTVAVRSWHTSS